MTVVVLNVSQFKTCAKSKASFWDQAASDCFID